jgi:RHH-type transcriptional regulator, rel operon repressor / antitoxin RelB
VRIVVLLYLYSKDRIRMGTRQLSIRVPEEIDRRLGELARRTGRSRTFYIKEAILDHLEDLEDTYLGEEALRQIRESGEPSVPLEDVEWPE